LIATQEQIPLTKTDAFAVKQDLPLKNAIFAGRVTARYSVKNAGIIAPLIKRSE
jgi:hypothetical protein